MFGRPGEHFSYCTNIHPGSTVGEIVGNLGSYTSKVAELVGSSQPFGLGVWLTDHASSQLDEARWRELFEQALIDNRQYLFTINAFPMGAFHGTRVKESVYQPDWRSESRVAYTIRVARVMAKFLPESVEYGSISTVPGCFRSPAVGPDDVATIARNYLRVTQELKQIEDDTGKWIQLAIEPEPGCLFESTSELVHFFKEELLASPSPISEACIHRYIGACLDTCHAAVEFESAPETVQLYRDAGMTIAKVQLSSAIEARGLDDVQRNALAAFVDETYLHQTVVKGDTVGSNELRRYVDLPDALSDVRHTTGETWRVHYHIPIFVDCFGPLRSTRRYLEELLSLHCRTPISAHFEVETYTWEVLPLELRGCGVEEAIARELSWVRTQLADIHQAV